MLADAPWYFERPMKEGSVAAVAARWLRVADSALVLAVGSALSCSGDDSLQGASVDVVPEEQVQAYGEASHWVVVAHCHP